MTDLPTILPNFSTQAYSHLIPSLDRHGITVTDLLSLDALEIARRATLPILDLRKLAQDVIHALHYTLDIDVTVHKSSDELFSSSTSKRSFPNGRNLAKDVLKRWHTISLLDASLDDAIGGGIPTGYLTEITGESAAGKTQFLLTLLLSAQLPPPLGLSRSSIYISTEAALSTTRLAQLLQRHPRLCELPLEERPSLARVLAVPVQDLESQDHVLAFQLPNAIRQHNVGLVVLDSVAANYRAEHGSAVPRDLANRAAQLANLGKLLRDLAIEENIAVVVANQVSDRFEEPNLVNKDDQIRSTSPMASSSPASPSARGIPLIPPSSSAGPSDAYGGESTLSLDFQQRFFTGWGDETYGTSLEGMKTPALGLGWTNQIACRIALKMEAWRGNTIAGPNDGNLLIYQGGNIWKDRKKRRFLRVVFAPWAAATMEPVEYEIKPEGITACNMKDVLS